MHQHSSTLTQHFPQTAGQKAAKGKTAFAELSAHGEETATTSSTTVDTAHHKTAIREVVLYASTKKKLMPAKTLAAYQYAKAVVPQKLRWLPSFGGFKDCVGVGDMAVLGGKGGWGEGGGGLEGANAEGKGAGGERGVREEGKGRGAGADEVGKPSRKGSGSP